MTLLRLSIIIKLLTITDMHRCIHAHLPRKTFTHMHSNKITHTQIINCCLTHTHTPVSREYSGGER